MIKTPIAATLRALGHAPASGDAASNLVGARQDAASAALTITLAFVVLRLIGAGFIGLGTDESYSIAVARDLHASYFDHPPMHYWLAHAVEPLFGFGRMERLPFILLFGGSSWMLFVLTRRLFGDAAGLWAVVALNVSGFFTLAAGSWVLPDGPLIFFELAAAAVLARLWFGNEPRHPILLWLTAGLLIGLAGLSKYQAALFGLGLGIFLISTARGRAAMKTPGPYLAAVTAVVVLSPVLVWNAGHGWASFAFQAGRGATKHTHILGPLVALAGQFAVLLPWVFIPLAGAAIAALRAGPGEARGWLCVMLGLPAIAVFTLAPLLGAPTLPHWPMPGWVMTFPLLGAALARAVAQKTWPRTWAVASMIFVVVVGGLGASDSATGWLGARFPKLFRHGDPTAESIEWTQLRDIVTREPILHRPGAPGFIAALKWNEAGKLDQAVGDLAPVALLSNDPRQFRYRHPTSGLVGQDALIIGRPDTVKRALKDLAPYFRSLQPLPPVQIGRDGHAEISLSLIEAHGLIRPYALAR